MIKPIPIHSRLIFCLVASLVLLVWLALYLQSSLQQVTRFQPELVRRLAAMERLDAAPDLLALMRTSARGYLETGDIAFLDSYYVAKKLLSSQILRERAEAGRIDDLIPKAAERRRLVEEWIHSYADPAIEQKTRANETGTDPVPPVDALSSSQGMAVLAEGDATLAQINRLTSEIAEELDQFVAGLSSEQAFAARDRVALMWVFVSVVILLTIGLQWWTGRSIVNPLLKLRDAVSRLRAGNYAVRIKLKTLNEIENLGSAFNEMAESIQRNEAELREKNKHLSEQQERLRELNHELEHRVDAKTEELKVALLKEESERTKIEKIILRMPDGLILLDERGTISTANEKALQILGHRDVESVQDWIDRTPGAFAFRQLNHQSIAWDEFPFNRAFHGESFSNFVLYVRRPDNSTRLVSFSGGPVLGQGLGGTTLSVCIFRDVTEELAMRKELEETNLQLNEASRLKDEFLAQLSHELRTPLTPIITCSQLLKSDAQLEPDDAMSVEMIERNALSLSRMIDEMLDLSAIMNAKVSLSREPTEMGQWIRSTIATLHPAMEKKKLVCDYEPWPKPLFLNIDTARLTQVLTNLLSNAIKYTDPGGRINVTLTVDAKNASIRVRDTGVGMNRHELNEVFEMFHQTRTALARRSGGLGIGLSIAKSLAEMHGGGITADSPGPGLGSTFRLWLPLRANRARAEEVPNDKPPPQQFDRRLLRGRRVLLVEDSEDTQEALSRILERRQCKVFKAGSGEEGLTMARKERPEIIISDLGLPQMDGLEFIRELQSEGDFASVVAISLSGRGREEDVNRALAAGFDAHLLKPVDIDELDRCIVQAIQKHAPAGEALETADETENGVSEAGLAS